jgi:transcriptional regulator with XRE-family HTH domain
MAQTLDRAVEADEILAALRGYGFTQADVARAVGVSDRAVRSWSQQGSLRRRNEERLHELRRIVLLLDDSLSHRGVGQWFRAHNRLLEGRRPLDVLAEGDTDAVRRAAGAFADGAYA